MPIDAIDGDSESALGHPFQVENADSPYRGHFVWVLRQLGIERVLFRSDYPLHTPSEAIADVERLGLTDEEMHQVFFGNARALLGLTAEDVQVAP